MPFLSGCEGCVHKLYGVHEDPTYIYIPIKTDLSKQQLKDKIDALAKINYDSTCNYQLLKYDNERMVYLSSCDAALVEVENNLIKIKAFCMPRSHTNYWIFYVEQAAVTINDSIYNGQALIKNKVKSELLSQ